jgi:hypothetical protein
MEDQPGYKNQIRALTKQVKLIGEILNELTNYSSMDKKNTTQGNYERLMTTFEPQKVWGDEG